MSEQTFLGAAIDTLREHAWPHFRDFIDEDVVSQREFGEQVLVCLGKLAWLDFRGTDTDFEQDLLKKAVIVKSREVLQGARLTAFDAKQETLWAFASIAGKFAKIAFKSATGLG